MSEKSFAAKTFSQANVKGKAWCCVVVPADTVQSALPWQVSMKQLCEVLGFQSPFGLPCHPPDRFGKWMSIVST